MFEKEQSKIEGLQQEKTVQKGKVEGQLYYGALLFTQDVLQT